ncbi:uncharacterized protein LOC134825032 [Bolinopsis microptera]|uniref:uncharacterized protein LOC134825032 n=1 Tax=Bolinopsis microptera TaxID=2820187 RepID=UPI00307AFC16
MLRKTLLLTICRRNLDVNLTTMLAIEARHRERAERHKPPKDPGFTENVKYCIIALNSCRNSSESMEVCKVLLQMIHEAECRNPGRDYVKDVVKVGNTEGSDLEREAFLHICSFIGDLNVLPLISAIVAKDEEYYAYSFQGTFFCETTYLRRLINVASTAKELKHVVEIFFYIGIGSFYAIDCDYNKDKVISVFITNLYPEVQSLLLKVKTYWEEEELVHATIKLMFYLIKLASPAQHERLLNDGAISTVNSILISLYSKDLYLTSLDRSLNYPKSSDLERPLAEIWLDCLGILACTDHQILDLLDVTRQMIPIMCQFVQGMRSSRLLATYNGIYVDPVTDALSILLKSDHRDDFQQFVVCSGIIPELLKTYETYRANFNHLDRAGNRIDPFLEVIEMFVAQCIQFLPETTQDKINILPVYLAILKSRKLYKENALYIDVWVNCERQRRRSREGLGSCGGLPFAAFCYNEIKYYLATEQTSVQLLDVLCNETYIAAMANLAEREPNLLAEVTINTISLIPLERITSEIIAHKISLLDETSRKGSFALVKRVTEELSLLDLQYSKQHATVRKMVDTFCLLHNKYGLLNILQKDSIMEMLPLLWKKVIYNPELRETVDKVVQLTMNLSLVLPLHLIPDVSLLESNVITQIRKTGLSDPGVIRLAWSMVKCGRHKLLIKELSKISASSLHFHSSTLFFYSSDDTCNENTSISNIFEILTDIIIRNLDKDAPEYEEHLVKFTSCMVEIAKYRTLPEEGPFLEQMVSPAMCLLGRVSSEVVIENVREFVGIFHVGK